MLSRNKQCAIRATTPLAVEQPQTLALLSTATHWWRTYGALFVSWLHVFITLVLSSDVLERSLYFLNHHSPLYYVSLLLLLERSMVLDCHQCVAVLSRSKVCGCSTASGVIARMAHCLFLNWVYLYMLISQKLEVIFSLMNKIHLSDEEIDDFKKKVDQ